MKPKTFFRTMLLCLSLLAFTNSCEREDEEEEEEVETVSVDPYGSWKRGDGQVAYVKFEGSAAYSCANGVITEGTFNKSDPSMTYVIQGNIIKFPLKFVDANSLLVGVPDQAINTNNATMYYRSSSFCSTSGGGSGGGTSTTGKALFWTSSDLGCGSITVTLSGSTGTISQYYSSGTPDCGASGCANFSLPAGSYNFTAKCSTKNWSGTITITADGCSRMRLTS